MSSVHPHVLPAREVDVHPVRSYEHAVEHIIFFIDIVAGFRPWCDGKGRSTGRGARSKSSAPPSVIVYERTYPPLGSQAGSPTLNGFVLSCCGWR